jgi:hypothetical protein
MSGSRIAVPIALAFACAVAALAVVPRGIDAGALLHAQDDPARLADLGLKRRFDTTVATREIEAALAANDIDLANSYIDLAREQSVTVDPALAERVAAANTATATTVRAVDSFGRGLVTGEPTDVAGLAGSAVGDLFVFGDLRDAAREGSRLMSGEKVDELILGLACVGLAITAGTYVSLGSAAPARVGVSVVKVARRGGKLSARMAEWMTRSVREAVDWGALKGKMSFANLVQPVAAVRAVREVVKVEKSRDLMRVVGDIGRVQGKAGTRAAIDGLKVAHGPRDLARVARLAESKGTKTRAILKTLGRSAFLLASTTFHLFSWVFSAVMAVFGFCAACKRTAERATERWCQRRRLRLAREALRAATAHA